jgi:hypothetical protein
MNFLKRIGITFFSALPAFRGYKVAYSNRGYFSSSESLFSQGKTKLNIV